MGWIIFVYRQKKGGTEPATFKTQEGAQLAESSGWWVHDLADAGRAMDLGGDGYPHRYTARAEHIFPEIISGKEFNADLAKACDPNEWLLIEAWDST